MKNKVIKSYLLSKNITSNYKGYSPLVDSLQMYLNDKTILFNVCKNVYKNLGEKYRTNSDIIQRDINTIKKNYNKKNNCNIKTNKEFIANLGIKIENKIFELCA